MRVAVIPARGGSKRIPRKNILEFGGKPLIAHSIECAQSSDLFQRVIVSTDDEEISGIARDFGAEVPFLRPGELSDDHSGTVQVMAHATRWLQDEGTRLSAVCCIYAIAPFIHAADLQRGLEILETGNWQYVFSASVPSSSPFRSFLLSTSGKVELLFPEHATTRSQDLHEIWNDAGQFYWGRPQAWLEELQILGEASTVVSIPSWRVQDIDTWEDLERARLIWRTLQVGEDRG